MSDLLIKAPMVYEPLKNNRFLVRFPSDLGIQEWWVQKFSGTSYTNNAVEIPFLNTSNWVIGKYSWDDISMTLIDSIGPSSTQAIMEWVRLQSESITGRQGYAVGYKRDLILEKLDPTGVVISQWLIKEAMLTSVKFSENSYTDDGVSTIDITVKPFYCINCY